MFSVLQRNDKLIPLIPATIALCYFLISGGETFWIKTMHKCQALDTKTSIVARIDCYKSVVDFIIAAVAIFIGMYVLAAWIRGRSSGSGCKQQRSWSDNVG
jgi:hypothetical protein